MKILVFGNLLVDRDNLALKLIPKLQQAFNNIEFKEFDPAESLENEIENKTLTILDVAEGIKEVVVLGFDDIDKLENDKVFSMHDFDLAYNLKLLKKMELLDDIKIIAIPNKMDEGEALSQIKNFIHPNP